MILLLTIFNIMNEYHDAKSLVAHHLLFLGSSVLVLTLLESGYIPHLFHNYSLCCFAAFLLNRDLGFRVIGLLRSGEATKEKVKIYQSTRLMQTSYLRCHTCWFFLSQISLSLWVRSTPDQFARHSVKPPSGSCLILLLSVWLLR